MTDFRRIVKPLLVILLQLSESHQIRYEFAARGNNVTLPCENVEPGQRRCALTTWIHESVDRKEVTLIDQGIIGVARKVNLTKECSLLIEDVRAREAGRYKCKQYDGWGQGSSDASLISLSIVSLSEVKNSSGLWELKCAVATNLRRTTVDVKWLNIESPLSETHPHLTPNESHCCSSVRVPESSYKHLRSRLSCEVTHDYKKHRFTLSAERPEESTVKPTTTAGTQPTKNWNVTARTQEEERRQSDSNERRDSAEDRTASGLKGWWWAVIAAGVVLLIAVAIFVTRRRVRVKQPDPSGAPSAEEGVSYASVSFNKSHVNTRISAREEAVIYSSVRSAASEDPAQLYASVNK